MTLKCKNPYFDENIDRKFVFLLYCDLLEKGINLGERCFGLFLKADNVVIIDTEADYNRCMFTEVSIYKAFQYCIPDGIRYNKELDKLVPDVITDFKSKEYSMTDWANENLNLNIVAFDDVEQDKKEILNNLGHGHKKAKPFISGIKWQKIDNGGNHIAADGTPFDTIEEALNHNCTLVATSSDDEYCSGIKVELEKVMDHTDKKENNPIEPNHYTEMKISPLEYIEANHGDFTWCIANVIKYVSRHKRKNGIEDLKKAQWYLNHEINRLEIIEGMANVK